MNKTCVSALKYFAASILGMTLSLSAIAQVPLVNPSFETPVLDDGQIISPMPDGFGWTFRGGVDLVNGVRVTTEVPMGRQWIQMRSGTAISQQVSLQANTTYYVALQAMAVANTASGQTIRVSMNGVPVPVLTPTTTTSQLTFAGFSISSAGTYTLQIELPDPPSTTAGAAWIDNIVLNQQGANSAPSVAISTPVHGRSYPDVYMTVVATAIDSDGTISKVEFYDGATLLGTRYSPPYELNLTLSTIGTKNLTAKAYDNLNLATTSSAVVISHSAGTAKPYVANGGFEYPRVPFATVIGNYPYYDAPPWQTTGGFIASAGALVPGFSNVPVSVYNGRQSAFADAQYTGVGVQQPITLPAGQYGLSFSGTPAYNGGWNVQFGGVESGGGYYPATRHSTIITSVGGAQYLRFYTSGFWQYGASSSLDDVKIGPVGPPVVTVTAAAPSTTFVAPTAVRLMVNSEVYDATITQVEIFKNVGDTTPIATLGATFPVASFDWLNVAPGTYQVYAKVTDSKSRVTNTQATPLTITVGAPTAPAFFNAGFEYGLDWGSINLYGPSGWTTQLFYTCYYCAVGAGKGAFATPAGTVPPEGVALGLLKGGGWMQQPVYMPDGSYKIGFKSSQLGGGSGQTFQISVNGVSVGTFTPGAAFADYQTAQFTVGASGTNLVGPAGLQTVKFESTTPGVSTYVGIDTLVILPQVSATVPGAPTIGTATAGNAQATVSFTAPASNGGSAITGYTVTSSPGALTAAGSASPLTVFGLTNGTAYTFTVTATNAIGTSAASAASNSVIPATVPGAPTIGTATAGNAQATVTFTAPASNGGSAITGYTVTSNPAGGVDSNAGTTGLSHVITGLTNGTAYTFTVTATNAKGTSAASAATNPAVTPAANTAPGAPTAASATAGNASATVTFTAPASNGGSAITGYTVTSNPAGGVDSNAGTTGLSHVITGLTNGTAYTFTVTATNAIGTSAASAATSPPVTPAANTAPGAPTGASATAGNASAIVTFTAPASNGGSAISGYTVTSSPAGGVDGNAGTTGLSHVITGLTNGTAYTFTVTATNAIGTGAASAPTNPPVTPATVPGVPTSASATAGNASATVTFTAPASNGGSAITGYTVTSSPAGGVDSNAGTTGLSHVITGLTNGTAYTFTVTATNAKGTSAASTATSPPVTPAANTAPGAPTAASATAGNASATVTFTAPASNGGSAITGYTVTSSPAGGVDSNAGSTGLSHVITGLTNGTAYTFTVTATNAIGTSAASAASNSVTPTSGMGSSSIVNGSFESPLLLEGQSVSPVPAGQGWTILGDVDLINGALNVPGIDVPMGRQWIRMHSGNAISQSLTLSAGTYTVSLLAMQAPQMTGGQTVRVSLGSGSPPIVLTPSATLGTLSFGTFTVADGTSVLSIDLPDPANAVGGLLIDSVMLSKQGTNSAPVVAISYPVDGQPYSDTVVNIVANAIDPDGTITKVQFFEGSTQIGTDLLPPFQSPMMASYAVATAGMKAFTVRAFDSSGQMTVSSAVTVSLNKGTAKPFIRNGSFDYPRLSAPSNAPQQQAIVEWQQMGYAFVAPTGGIYSPGQYTTYPMTAMLGRQSAFVDAIQFNNDGTGPGFQQPLTLPVNTYGISFAATTQYSSSGGVPYQAWDVQVDQQKIGSATVNQARHAVTFTSTGALQYIGFRGAGTPAQTAGWSFHTLDEVKIGPAGPPIITVTAAAPSNTFVAPTAIRLLVSTEVYDATVTQVEIFKNVGDATPIATLGAAFPAASFDWLNVAPGTYQVYAKVTDSLGRITKTDTTPLTITVGVPTSPGFFNAGFEYGNHWSGTAIGTGWSSSAAGCPGCAQLIARGTFTVPSSTPVPEGLSVAVIGSSGWIEQQVYLKAGDYRIELKAAQLAVSGSQGIAVSINGAAPIAQLTPSSTQFKGMRTARFNVAADGLKTIRFAANDPQTNFVMIDDLKITSLPPAIGTLTASASLASSAIAVGTTTTFSIIVNNPSGTAAINGLTFSQLFPAGVVVDTTPNITSSGAGCAMPVATAGGNTFDLASGIIAAGGSCTYTVKIKGVQVKQHSIPAAIVDADNANQVSTAALGLGVYAPPSASIDVVTPFTIPNGVPVTVTLANPSTNTAVSGAGFSSVSATINFPANLKLKDVNTSSSSSCATITDATTGGALTLNSTGVKITAANLAAGAANCVATFNVTTLIPGTYSLTTTPIALVGTSSVAGTAVASQPTVAKPAFDVLIQLPPAPYVTNTPTVFTATASSGAGAAPTFTFYIDNVLQASGVAGSGLSRTLTLSNLLVGNHTIRAVVDSQTVGQSSLSKTFFVSAVGLVLNAENFTIFSPATALLRVTTTTGALPPPEVKLYDQYINPPYLFQASDATSRSLSFSQITSSFTFTARIKDANGVMTSESNPVTLNVLGADAPEAASEPDYPTGTAIGATAASFDTSESGAASYSIPIALPPGIAGMAPSLGLGYSSQGGDGIAGAGWSLSGFSVIHRCAANPYVDGIRGSVNYDTNDKFCIDGQRLVSVSPGSSEYRTAKDGFSRITSIGGTAGNPSSWKVESKSGLVMLYGSSETNAGAQSVVAGPNNMTKSWALNKVKDRKSNYYKIDYVIDVANAIQVAQRPTVISYTGNDTAGSSTFATVELGYVANLPAEQALMYSGAGAQSQMTQRLKTITTKEGGITARVYTLEYTESAASHRSLLSSITECGYNASGTTLCLPATVVTTPAPAASESSFAQASATGDAVALHTDQTYAVDLNGDGKTDLIRYKGSNNWGVRLSGTGNEQIWNSPGGNDTRVVFGDFNGDGKTDFISETLNVLTRCISTGTGFNCAVVNVAPRSNVPGSAGDGWMLSGDFDGDGRIDLAFYAGGIRPSTWYVCLANDTGFAPCTGPHIGPKQRDDTPGPGNMVVGDFNGDGRADIAGFGDAPYTNQWQVAFSNFSNFGGVSAAGFGLAPQTQAAYALYGGPNKTIVADLNGDGLADLIAPPPASFPGGANNKWHVCLSKGNGEFSCSAWAGRVGDRENAVLGDFNGDGRTDIAQYNDDISKGALGWTVCLSMGTSFNCSVYGNVVAADSANDSSNFNKYNIPGDFDGNGKTDIAIVGRGGWPQWRVLSTGGVVPDMASKIRDGLGKEVNFTYESLTTSAAYTKGAGATSPLIDIQSPMYVVTSMTTQDGIGGFRNFSYSYKGLTGHAQGAGLLGFAERKVSDSHTGRITTTTYSQNYANRTAGAPIAVEVRNSGLQLLSQSSSSYYTRTVAGSSPAIYQVFPSSSATSSYDPVLSTTSPFTTTSTSIPNPAIDIDAYGNVKKSTVTSDVTKTTNTDFDIDDANWLTGRQSSVSITTTYGGQSLTRRSTFGYLAGTPLVSSETIEPAAADGTPSVTSDHVYDTFGNRTETRVSGAGITDTAASVNCPTAGVRNCRRMTVAYADNRYATSTINAAGHGSSMGYESKFGAAKTSTDVNGLVSRAKYDALGRKIWSYDPRGVNTNVSFGGGAIANAVMSVTTTSSGSPSVVSHVDMLGREIRRDMPGADSVSNSITTTYDPRGRKSSVTRPYPTSGAAAGATGFIYEDNLDRLIREDAPDGGKTVITPSGFTTTVCRHPTAGITPSSACTGTGEQKTVRTINSEGWTLGVTDATGQAAGFTYNPHGNLMQVTKPGGQTATTMDYDIRGQKKWLNDPDAGYISYGYNAAGELTSETVSGGRSVTTTMDAIGRPLVRIESVNSGGAKEYRTDFTYDYPSGVGKLGAETMKTTNGSSIIYNIRSWTYDAYSRVKITDVTVGNGIAGGQRTFRSGTGYDTNSRVNAVTYPVTGSVMSYSYGNGYLATASFNGATIWQTSERYADQQVKKAFIGGANAAGAVFTLDKAYDAAGRVNSHTATHNSTTLQSATFSFDAIGNLKTRTDSAAGQNESYCYDTLNRVLGTGTSTCSNIYGYDSYGNLTSKPGATLAYVGTTANNRLSSVNGGAIVYDNGGNITSDGARQFAYSAFNVPDRITKTATNEWMEYGFTGDHQRTYERRGTGANATNPTGITYYAAPGFFEQDEDIAATVYTVKEYRQYLNTPEGTVGVVVSKPNAADNVLYYLKDHLGSNVATVTSLGDVENRNSFDPWGLRTQSNSNTADHGDRGFTGHEHIGFGLIHMNGRVYDPVWGRFLQADPIVQSPHDLQSYNRYSYVMNNPLSFTDPTGFSRWTNFRNRYGRTILAIAVSWVIGPAGFYGNWVGGSQYLTAAASGFAAGGIQGGNMNSALTGAFSAMFTMGLLDGFNLPHGAPQTWGQFAGKAAVHFASGCASAAASGDSCGRGGASAAIAEIASNTAGEFGLGLKTGSLPHFATHIAGGCLGGKVSGGGCANGSFSAAFAYLFNELVDFQQAPVKTSGMPVLQFIDDSIVLRASLFLGEVQSEGIPIKLTDAFRTNGMQALLAGNANGGAKYGTSLHEAGYAFDVNWNELTKSQRAVTLGLAEKWGFSWGGSFKPYDPFHFYIDPFKNMAARRTAIRAAQHQFLD